MEPWDNLEADIRCLDAGPDGSHWALLGPILGSCLMGVSGAGFWAGPTGGCGPLYGSVIHSKCRYIIRGLNGTFCERITQVCLSFILLVCLYPVQLFFLLLDRCRCCTCHSLEYCYCNYCCLTPFVFIVFCGEKRKVSLNI